MDASLFFFQRLSSFDFVIKRHVYEFCDQNSKEPCKTLWSNSIEKRLQQLRENLTKSNALNWIFNTFFSCLMVFCDISGRALTTHFSPCFLFRCYIQHLNSKHGRNKLSWKRVKFIAKNYLNKSPSSYMFRRACYRLQESIFTYIKVACTSRLIQKHMLAFPNCL